MVRVPHSTPEIGMLVGAARVFAGGTLESDDVLTASRPVDWDHLLELAEGHGLLPVLHHEYSVGGAFAEMSPEPPASFRLALRQRALQRGIRSLHQLRTLLKIVEHFDRAGVLVLPLKGVVFAQEAYGEVGLRPSGDIDLLVAPEDRLPAEEVLKLAGATPADERNPERHSVWTLDGALIELHPGCEGDWCSRRVARDLFFRRRRLVELGPRTVEAFSIESTILYACSHCASHYVTPFVTIEGLKLGLYLDLALFLRMWEKQIDWVHLIEQSERLSSSLVVRPHLLVALALFNPPVPPEIKRWLLRDKTARHMAGEVMRDLMQTSRLQADGTKGEVARLGKFRRVCKVYGSPYRGMLHLARTNWDAMFTVSQLDRMAYPNVQSTALLVPLRLCRITSSYVVPLLRRR